jgi:hypothetical protein
MMRELDKEDALGGGEQGLGRLAPLIFKSRRKVLRSTESQL